LTTLDVVARPVNRFPEDGLDLVEQIVLAPAGTAAGTAYVAATLGVRAAVASQVGSDGAGQSVRALLTLISCADGPLAVGVMFSATLIQVRLARDRPDFDDAPSRQ
jgi:sugar/nucleoside kinase (ribokinase family)